MDCSPAKEVQWHAVIIERLPHCNRNRNAFLIDFSVFLSTSKEDIQVAIVRVRISQSSRSVDTSSEKDGAVLRCDRGQGISPKSIGGFIPVRDQMFWEEQHGGMRLDNRCLHGLGRVVFGREVGVALSCAPIVCVDGFPSCGEVRLPVMEMKDESKERQTEDALRWLEPEDSEKDHEDSQAEPLRAGEKKTRGKKGRSPSDDTERRHRSEQDAQRHIQCSFSARAREQQTPGQSQQSGGG